MVLSFQSFDCALLLKNLLTFSLSTHLLLTRFFGSYAEKIVKFVLFSDQFSLRTFFASDAILVILGTKKTFVWKKKRVKKVDLSLRLYFTKVRIVKKLDFQLKKKEKDFLPDSTIIGRKNDKKINQNHRKPGRKNQKTKNVSKPLLIPTFCPY